MTDETEPGERGGDGAAPERTFVQKEIVVLLLLSLATTAAFVFTRTAAAGNREMRQQDAAAWFERGRQAAADGRKDDAVRAFQRAGGMEADNQRYRLALAGALAADSQEEAARQVLLGVRERAPEDPGVNLQLARIEAQRGDTTAAEKYYHNALYGSWRIDDAEARRAARFELVRYLLDHGNTKRAVSELLVLSGNLPEDSGAEVDVARLFLRAGDSSHALDHFERTLEREPGNNAALAGAAQAAFLLADDPKALRYARQVSGDPDVAEMRGIAEQVLSADPLRPRLSAGERRARAVAGFASVRSRLEACAA
ncbi:MAG: tetratricopeptide repeat protein, partial [Acidobacteriota bacterium]